jgi:hypothetical protein
MKTRLLFAFTTIILFLMPNVNFAQAPSLGSAVNTTMEPYCMQTGVSGQVKTTDAVSIYPNPFKASIRITLNNSAQKQKYELKFYNILGVEIMSSFLSEQSTTLITGDLSSGVYIYKIFANTKLVQAGRLVSRK